MWQVFQEETIARAKEHLGVSKGKLSNGKETWFWKGDAIRKAVTEKKAAFKLWSKCPASLIDEKERLRIRKNETKKVAAREVAKAKAAECQKFYEDLAAQYTRLQRNGGTPASQ